jgi:hypothetical protein
MSAFASSDLFSPFGLAISNPKVVALGKLMLIQLEKLRSPKSLFSSLALGGKLLTRDVFLLTCRTKLHAQRQGPNRISDGDVLDLLAVMLGQRSASAKGAHLGEFRQFLVFVGGGSSVVRKSASLLNQALVHKAATEARTKTSRSPSSRVVGVDESAFHADVGIKVFGVDDLIYSFKHTERLQFFDVPFTGWWEVRMHGGFGGSFGLQQGGKPAEVTAPFHLEEGWCLVIGVGGGGSMTFGGGGGASFVAADMVGRCSSLLKRSTTEAEEEERRGGGKKIGVYFTDVYGNSREDGDEAQEGKSPGATLLAVAGGGGGAGRLDGVEASISRSGNHGLSSGVTARNGGKKGTDGLPVEVGSGGKVKGLMNFESYDENGKGMDAHNAGVVVSAASLERFSGKSGYGGIMGGGDAAEDYSLSRSSRLRGGGGGVSEEGEGEAALQEKVPSFFAGGGGGGGYSGGGGGTLSGGGGGSFINKAFSLQRQHKEGSTSPRPHSPSICSHEKESGDVGNGEIHLKFIRQHSRVQQGHSRSSPR